MRSIVIFITFIITWSFFYGETRAEKIDRYVRYLETMSQEQKMLLAASYRSGARKGLGITQAAIVWKESGFGKILINESDGLLGSFGLGQILLTTSANRHKVKTKEGLARLRERLVTDHVFNLNESLTELVTWRKIHQSKRSDWWIYMVASYNAGHKSYTSKAGKRYADDVNIRVLALKKYFKEYEQHKQKNGKVVHNHLLSIKKDLYGN